jgi:hypothetical protein
VFEGMQKKNSENIPCSRDTKDHKNTPYKKIRREVNTMKYLYVLTSSQNDSYYGQFLLSVTSLRMYNPLAEIIVVIDEKTRDGLTGKRSAYEKIVSDICVVSVPDTLSQKEVSRWLKTSMRSYVTGDFLFIDCDTIIAEDLSGIFNRKEALLAVLDKHVLIEKHHMKSYILSNDAKLGFKSATTNRHYNSGVIFCKDTGETRAFFARWHELWLQTREKNILVDQPSFNQAIFETGCLAEMGGEWNCQIAYGGLRFLHEAKIVHYYSSSLITVVSPYSLAATQVLTEIQETGFVSEETLEKMKSPKTAFEDDCRIVAGEAALGVLNSNLFAKLYWLRRKHPGMFNKLDALSLLFKNPEHRGKF